MRVIFALLSGVAIGAGGLYGAQHLAALHASSGSQPYAGQDTRQIASLSADDIRQLENGEGWGLAKPAELNGFPGPAHVLEFADQLELDGAQRDAIQSAFDSMNTKARELGKALIEAEAALDGAFSGGQATPAVLEERLRVTEGVRAALRQVHLAAHLEITPLLTDAQKTQYAELRGYGGAHDGHSGH